MFSIRFNSIVSTGCFKTRVQISKFNEIFSEGVNSVQQILRVVRGPTFLLP